MSTINYPEWYESDRLDNAVSALYASKPDGEGAVREATRDIITVVVEDDLPADTIEDAVNFLKSETGLSKRTLREIVKEKKQESSGIEMVGVTRHIHPEQDAEFEFEVSGGGGSCAFRLSAGELSSYHPFRQEVMARLGVVVSFDDWDGVLGRWLEDSEEVSHGYQNYLGERMLERIAEMPQTKSQGQFRNVSPEYVYVGEDVVWVPAEAVHEVAEDVDSELTSQAIRKKLDYMMLDGRGKTFRGPDGDLELAWRFKPYVADT